MDRRAFLGALTGGLLAAPLAAQAQQPGKMYRMVIVFTAASVTDMTQARDPLQRVLFLELRRLG